MKRRFFSRSVLSMWFSVTLSLVTIVAFQNCSPVNFKVATEQLDSSARVPADFGSDIEEPILTRDCQFNGAPVSEGSQVIAYLSSTVPLGETCKSEARSCQAGVLSGSYSYATCEIGAPAACLHNGVTIANGQGVVAYQNSSVAYGQSCKAEMRSCNNGILSGSYTFSSCEEGKPAACLFNGSSVDHGASTIAFQNSSVGVGQSCQSQARICNNGVLSGSYNYASCSVGQAASCLFNGRTINHGESVTGFLSSSPASGQVCQSQTRTCSNGVLSGSYQFASCNENSVKDCLFNSQTVANGQSVTAFAASSVSYGSSCQSQTRTCSNGVLSGTYQYGACSVGAASSCLFNGKTVASGQSVIAYASSTVTAGQSCSYESRQCSNGILSGSYSYETCTVAAQNCSFNGQTVYNGSSVLAYESSTVPYGQSCASQTRTCSNGFLSGYYGYSSCSVQAAPPASCNATLNKSSYLSSEMVYLTVNYQNMTGFEWSCDLFRSNYEALNIMSGFPIGKGPYPAGSYSCLVRGRNAQTGAIVDCNTISATVTDPAPVDVVISSDCGASNNSLSSCSMDVTPYLGGGSAGNMGIESVTVLSWANNGCGSGCWNEDNTYGYNIVEISGSSLRLQVYQITARVQVRLRAGLATKRQRVLVNH